MSILYIIIFLLYYILAGNKEVRIFESSNTENNTVAKENTQSMLQIFLLLVA